MWFKKIMQKYKMGRDYLESRNYIETALKTIEEEQKLPTRTIVINNLLSKLKKHTIYLEIGVRNPNDNFNLINASEKYSVDPGLEYHENPVDFKMTSDDFFHNLQNNMLLGKNYKFDLIFIDGLHLSWQVEKDIENALKFLTDDGFIVLHDCNPPTIWHAREDFHDETTPALKNWNGTTWKAFVKFRENTNYFSCCIDSDWGIGVISKRIPLKNQNTIYNPYFEYNTFSKNRNECLNLISYDYFEKILQKYY
jgi:SAM-dependent methyltransferase